MFKGEREPRCSLSPPLFTSDPGAMGNCGVCIGTSFPDRGWVLGPINSILGLSGDAVQRTQILWNLVATSAFFLLPCHLPSQGFKNH